MRSLTLLPIVLSIAASNSGADVFQVRYTGDVPPGRSEPAWREEGSATVRTEGGVLRVESTVDGFYSLTRDWKAEPGQGTYVRLRMRLLDYAGNRTLAGAALRIADGAHELILIFTPDYVYVFGTQMVHRMSTSDRLHEFRVSTSGNDFRLEVDGRLAIDGTGRFTQTFGGKNLVQVGDQSNQAGATIEIDDLAYALGRTDNRGPAYPAFAEDRFEAVEGRPIEVDLGATDPDDDAVVHSAEALPAGAKIDPATGRLAWTPPYDAAGEHVLRVRATDGDLSAEREVTIVVAGVNRAPEFTQPRKSHVAHEAGSPIIFNVRAVDEDGDELVYRAEGLPAGATFDPATRIFRWTPSAEQEGHHPMTFLVSDGTVEIAQKLSILIGPGK